MDILKKTKRDYNIIAPHFSQKRQFIWQDLKPFLKLVKKGNKVLDVGCGNGRLYKELKNKKIDYLGIDFSEKLLAIAKKNHPQAKFRLGDINKSKTWRNLKNFDICFCLAVLHHFPTSKEQLKVLRNIYRVFKNEGILVLSVWNLWQRKFLKLHLKQLSWKISKGFRLKWLKVPYKISDGRKVVKKIDRFCYAFGKTELENLVYKAGFTLVKSLRARNLCLIARKMVKFK